MEQLINDLKVWNITLTDNQLKQLDIYSKLLVEWNEKINLTAITDKNEILKKHFLDSMSMSQCIDELLDGKSLLDLGTGAGFPGIPLKILYPELNVTLVDSLNKRIDFLNEVINELGLTNITTIHSRAEDLAKDLKYREQFDYVVSRAVANLAVLSEYCIPFVKVDGYFISYKTDSSIEEINNARNAIGMLGGSKPKLVQFTLPNSDLGRINVCIKKSKNTPDQFPRKAGTPSKKPL